MQVDNAFTAESELIKEKWLTIQKRSYTNWINEVLRPTGEAVTDLVDDIGNGVLLCKLAMLLTMKKIKYQKTPKLLFQKQDNIQKALLLLEQSGCRMVNIRASDILNKNTKLILGLMWQLVQHFHVFQSIKNIKQLNDSLREENLMGEKESATDELVDMDKYRGSAGRADLIKKKMLADINRRLARRNITVTNFKSNWHNGDALCALVDYNVRGIYDLYQESDPIMKIAESMIAAYKFLGIPQLIEPEDFMSPHIDAQTMSMYLSCFLHEGVENIVVDLFEGIEPEHPPVSTGLQKMEIQGEQDEGALLADVTQHVIKKLRFIHPASNSNQKHSLNEILSSNKVRRHSEEPEDEGIGEDILTNVHQSIHPPVARSSSPDQDTGHSFSHRPEGDISKISLEDSLLDTKPVEDALVPRSLSDDDRPRDFDATSPNIPVITPSDVKLNLECPLELQQTPSAVEVKVSDSEDEVKLLSPIDQAQVRQKLGEVILGDLNFSKVREDDVLTNTSESEEEERNIEVSTKIIEPKVEKELYSHMAHTPQHRPDDEEEKVPLDQPVTLSSELAPETENIEISVELGEGVSDTTHGMVNVDSQNIEPGFEKEHTIDTAFSISDMSTIRSSSSFYSSSLHSSGLYSPSPCNNEAEIATVVEIEPEHFKEIIPGTALESTKEYEYQVGAAEDASHEIVNIVLNNVCQEFEEKQREEAVGIDLEHEIVNIVLNNVCQEFEEKQREEAVGIDLEHKIDIKPVESPFRTCSNSSYSYISSSSSSFVDEEEDELGHEFEVKITEDLNTSGSFETALESDNARPELEVEESRYLKSEVTMYGSCSDLVQPVKNEKEIIDNDVKLDNIEVSGELKENFETNNELQGIDPNLTLPIVASESDDTISGDISHESDLGEIQAEVEQVGELHLKLQLRQPQESVLLDTIRLPENVDSEIVNTPGFDYSSSVTDPDSPMVIETNNDVFVKGAISVDIPVEDIENSNSEIVSITLPRYPDNDISLESSKYIDIEAEITSNKSIGSKKSKSSSTSKKSKSSSNSSMGKSNVDEIEVISINSSGTIKSSNNGSIYNGGSEIVDSSTASVEISNRFPTSPVNDEAVLHDSKMIGLIDKMHLCKEEYDVCKLEFQKFVTIRSTDSSEGAIMSFLKSCYVFRESLLKSYFKIKLSGEFVKFDDLPIPTSSKKKTKSTKSVVKQDPILAQLPNTLNNIRKSENSLLSRKKLLNLKNINNTSISLFTEILQNFMNFRSFYNFSLSSRNNDHDREVFSEFDDLMSELQDEVTMANLILSGQSSPE